MGGVPTNYEQSTSKKQTKTKKVTKRKAALLRATKLLHSILSILDRLCEALGVLRVLHSHQFLPTVLKSTLLPAPLAHRLADTTLGRMLEQPTFLPLTRLVAACVQEFRRAKNNPACHQLEQIAPTLLGTIERQGMTQGMARDRSEFYRQFVRSVDVGTRDIDQVRLC